MAKCPPTKVYGSTATYMGGVGACAMTEDICDRCWGSGDNEFPGPNLRNLSLRARDDEEITYLLREVAGLRAMLEACAFDFEVHVGKPWLETWPAPELFEWSQLDPLTAGVLQRAGIQAPRSANGN